MYQRRNRILKHEPTSPMKDAALHPQPVSDSKSQNDSPRYNLASNPIKSVQISH